MLDLPYNIMILELVCIEFLVLIKWKQKIVWFAKKKKLALMDSL